MFTEESNEWIQLYEWSWFLHSRAWELPREDNYVGLNDVIHRGHLRSVTFYRSDIKFQPVAWNFVRWIQQHEIPFDVRWICDWHIKIFCESINIHHSMIRQSASKTMRPSNPQLPSTLHLWREGRESGWTPKITSSFTTKVERGLEDGRMCWGPLSAMIVLDGFVR